MKKTLLAKDILDELGFSSNESDIFLKCLDIAKDEQKNDNIDAEKNFLELIEGVLKDEI